MTSEIFWATNYEEDAYVEYPGYCLERLEPSNCADSWVALISNFSSKRNRILKWFGKRKFFDDLDDVTGRIWLHHGGPLPICRVAYGDIDAVVEFQKGYKLIDLLPMYNCSKSRKLEAGNDKNQRDDFRKKKISAIRS